MCHKKLSSSLASLLPLNMCGFGTSTLGALWVMSVHDPYRHSCLVDGQLLLNLLVSSLHSCNKGSTFDSMLASIILTLSWKDMNSLCDTDWTYETSTLSRNSWICSLRSFMPSTLSRVSAMASSTLASLASMLAKASQDLFFLPLPRNRLNLPPTGLLASLLDIRAQHASFTMSAL